MRLASRNKSVQNQVMEAVVEMVWLEQGWNKKEVGAGHSLAKGRELVWLQRPSACDGWGHCVDQEGGGDKRDKEYFCCCPQMPFWV